MADDLRSTLRRIDAALSTPEPARDGWGGFALVPLLAHGARLAVPDDHEADGEVAPFTFAGPSDEPHAEPEVDAPLTQLDAISEFEIECMVPSGGWSDEDQAWFWRVKAKAFWFDYADASLNLTANCIGRALDWHVANAPADAALLWAARLRARLYASYSVEEVADELRRLLAHVDRTELAPAHERHLVLQLLEVMNRIRAVTPTFEAERLEALARRGLVLSEQLGDDAQRSQLLHGLADAMMEGSDDPPDADRIAEARRAWKEALDLEDGDFYGKRQPGHRETRSRLYRERLARLDVVFGDREAGVEALAAVLGDIRQPYEATNALRRTIRWMREHELERTALLEGVLRRQVLEREGEIEGRKAETLLRLLQWIDYELADAGARSSTRALVRQAYELPAMAAAEERRREREEVSRRRESAAEEKLLAALFGGRRSDGEPSEEVRRLAGLREALDRIEREARAELVLLRQRVVVGPPIEVEYVANVPEHAASVLLEELAPLLRELEAAARAVDPEADVRLEVEPLALGPGLSDRAELAIALGRVGATRTLEALELEARDDDGVDVEELAGKLRRRIIGVRMEHR